MLAIDIRRDPRGPLAPWELAGAAPEFEVGEPLTSDVATRQTTVRDRWG